jgi:hypothetical protein
MGLCGGGCSAIVREEQQLNKKVFRKQKLEKKEWSNGEKRRGKEITNLCLKGWGRRAAQVPVRKSGCGQPVRH